MHGRRPVDGLSARDLFRHRNRDHRWRFRVDHRHLLAGVPSRFKKWLATATKREKTEEDHQVDRFLFGVLILIISLILIGNEEK